MGVIDWVILAVLLLFMALGFRKGLAASLVQICAAIATFFLIGQLYPLVRNSLHVNFKLNGVLSTVFSVVLIGVVIMVLIRLLIYVLNRIIKAINLSFVNRLLGLVFGLANGLLCVIVCMVVFDYFPKMTAPLKDPVKHRVYSAVDTFKEDVFTKLELTQRDKYKEIVKAEKKIPENLEPIK